MNNDQSGLVASNLAKSFKKRQVVQDVSLSLRRGEIVGLLGPNGAGKTTCFYMMMGLIDVTKATFPQSPPIQVADFLKERNNTRAIAEKPG